MISYDRRELIELAESIDYLEAQFSEKLLLLYKTLLCSDFEDNKFIDAITLIRTEKSFADNIRMLMYEIPLEEMPLLVNMDEAPMIKTVATWRLRIGK